MPTASPIRIFRPRIARIYALAIGSVMMLAMTVMAMILPYPQFAISDRVGFLILGAIISWFCWRQASVCVKAEPDRVTVRNLFSTTRLEWAQIVDLTFMEGAPWATANLNTGDTLSLMAFQRTDGARGIAEAKEFQALLYEKSDPA
ncbi:PH domain-containing protein [Helcobacillus sp. ACRRO]|uniref:PH domain-containing protein n=1 Tax=Helcobacillus sp. ACRRO TaxID=2918202 RepID=UPI001EF711C4|nr:PH domain-containing protein [Helcobacillus sp. ACRRO]MCG7427354.1 PH domain-containing protein [Helcobacillus sp. ACRRO]